jgi:hypothetical protein
VHPVLCLPVYSSSRKFVQLAPWLLHVSMPASVALNSLRAPHAWRDAAILLNLQPPGSAASRALQLPPAASGGVDGGLQTRSLSPHGTPVSCAGHQFGHLKGATVPMPVKKTEAVAAAEGVLAASVAGLSTTVSFGLPCAQGGEKSLGRQSNMRKISASPQTTCLSASAAEAAAQLTLGRG